jgi:hypothetical protein
VVAGAVVAGAVVAGTVVAGAAVVGVVSTGSVSVVSAGASVATRGRSVVLVEDVVDEVASVSVVAVAPAGVSAEPDRLSTAITSAAVTIATAISAAPSARSSSPLPPPRDGGGTGS